jgi:hypothetical protein
VRLIGAGSRRARMACALADGLWHGEPGQFSRDRERLNRLREAGWRVVFVTARGLHNGVGDSGQSQPLRLNPRCSSVHASSIASSTTG